MTGGGATPDERRLVVNADDFGFSAGVNRGILEAHAAGVVSSVSVLVNTPGWPDARDRLRAIGGTLGVGLHLNLTTGAPLTTAPSLTTPPPIARFHSLAALVARALTGRLDPAHVAAECVAQLARLREAGVRVTHIDSHRHVHALPGVWGVVIETARRSRSCTSSPNRSRRNSVAFCVRGSRITRSPPPACSKLVRLKSAPLAPSIRRTETR